MNAAYSLMGLGCSGMQCNCNAPALTGLASDTGKTFSADEIVGKTLIAKTSVPVKAKPLDSEPTAFNVKAGDPVGVVYSYLNPATGRATLYWILEPISGKTYYVAHAPGRFDISSLKVQGATSSEQKLKEEKERERRENDPVGYYMKKYGLPALLIIGGIVVVGGLGREAVRATLSKKSAPAPAMGKISRKSKSKKHRS